VGQGPAGVTRRWNGIVKVTAGIASVGTVIGLAFGAWFAITAAIAGEAETRQQAVQELQLQNKADDVDFEIWKVSNAMDDIERRQENGVVYTTDERRLKGLRRQLDILLSRQGQVLERIEEAIK